MHSQINDPNDEEAGLITPEQIQIFIDRMITNSRFNDEYVSANGNWGEDGPIERWLIQLELWGRQSRQNLVRNNISSVLDEMKELAAQVNFPIEPGSKNELLVGRAMLRAEANYYEETIRRECKERGLPDCQNLKAMSLDVLRVSLMQAWQRELPNLFSGNSASSSQPTNFAAPKKRRRNPRPTTPADATQGSEARVIGKRRGRPPEYNWPAAKAFVEELLNKNGHPEVSPIDGWRSKTDIAKHVIAFLNKGKDDECGPEVNTVIETMNPWIDEWLRLHPSGF